MSQSPRVQPVTEPFTEHQQAAFKALMPPGMPPLTLFTTIARNEQVLNAFIEFGKLVYAQSSLEISDRELVIHRMCALCGAEYEWGVHAAFFAKKSGLSDEKLKATLDSVELDALLDDRERLLVRVVDEVQSSQYVTPETWKALKDYWTDAQCIELTVLAGLYLMISTLVKTLELEPEGFARQFREFAA